MNRQPESVRSSWFQRFLLPGFAFKAVIIGGGYATGRELAEFFLPAGPWGGLAGMVLSMLIWSVVAALTFALAHQLGAFDYRSFFKALLGRGWVVFEITYVLFVILILSVFGAVAGALGEALFGLPQLVGTLALAVCIVGFATFGNASVERLFKYVSFLLYGIYALFLLIALSSFGGLIGATFAAAGPDPGGVSHWAMGGISYAGYNIIGAVVILPTLRHLTSRRDAVVAGLIAGPLAMIPAILFFVCMAAYYPAIAALALPSDFLLKQMHWPVFHLAFQMMIFAALLESGTGAVHAINERVAAIWRLRKVDKDGAGGVFGARERGLLAAGLLFICMFVAQRFGLIALIANGYRALAYVLIAVYVVPLLCVGVRRLVTGPAVEVAAKI